MDYAAGIAQNSFPDEPLDSKDRRLIQTIGLEGSKGVGFNRLVGKSRGFASRSTVAVRVERLVRLGYLERSGEKRHGREKPVRLTFKCFTLMMSVEKTKEAAARLRASLRSFQARDTIREEALKVWWSEFRERYNAFFGMVGTIAVFYGTSASGDLFLPLMVEDYRALSTEFMTLVRSRAGLLSSLREILDEEAGVKGADLDQIRRNVREELLDPAVYRFRDWGEMGEGTG